MGRAEFEEELVPEVKKEDKARKGWMGKDNVTNHQIGSPGLINLNPVDSLHSLVSK